MYLQSEGGLRTQRGRCTECGKRWWFYRCSRGEPEPDLAVACFVLRGFPTIQQSEGAQRSNGRLSIPPPDAYAYACARSLSDPTRLRYLVTRESDSIRMTRPRMTHPSTWLIHVRLIHGRYSGDEWIGADPLSHPAGDRLSGSGTVLSGTFLFIFPSTST